MSLLLRIERHLRNADLSPTRFGRDSVGDPRLVFDLRRGRELRAKTATRIEDYLQTIGKER